MLTHTTYKLLHLIGIFLALCGIGGLWALATAATEEARQAAWRLLMMLHGVALLVVLVGGFGMLARLGISGAWPPWIWIKLVVWLLLAALPVALRRLAHGTKLMLFLAPLLAAVAAWAALFHIGTAS